MFVVCIVFVLQSPHHCERATPRNDRSMQLYRRVRHHGEQEEALIGKNFFIINKLVN